MSTAPKLPSYADIEALPEGVTGEIIDGELVVSPRPRAPHIESTKGLTVHLGGPFDYGIGGPGGWLIEVEPELLLEVDANYRPVVPDLAGWRLSTMPALPEDGEFRTPPDWVCEILSPSTASSDRVKKMPFYARCGIGHAWLVDPILRTLEVYRLENGRWSLLSTHSDDDEVRAEPFDAVPLPLSALWRVPAGAKPPAEAGG